MTFANLCCSKVYFVDIFVFFVYKVYFVYKEYAYTVCIDDNSFEKCLNNKNSTRDYKYNTVNPNE